MAKKPARRVYEIKLTQTIKATSTVLVEASSEAEAIEAARDREKNEGVDLEVEWENASETEFDVVNSRPLEKGEF